MKNSAEKLSGEKKSVIIFDVKLLSIFNIKLHSCWVIWLLNKYMVMPGALMSIICSVHVPWIKMLWIFHHFRLVFIFAASFRFWIKEFASNEQWTMHSQPPNPKRTIKLLEKQRSNRWWLLFVRECDRFSHIIFTMNATVTSFDYLSFPFFCLSLAGNWRWCIFDQPASHRAIVDSFDEDFRRRQKTSIECTMALR